MQEYAAPRLLELAPDASLVDTVLDRSRRDPDAVVFRRRDGARWAPVTAEEFATEVTALAAGLVARGVGAGDRVALMSRTRYEWTLCDYAVWAAGAVTVPVYETSSAEQVAWALSDSGAVLALVETGRHRALVEEVASSLPDLRHVVQVDGGGLDELSAAGRDVPAQALQERRAALTPASLATVIYTSGTTGRPKGCELTHGNLLSTGRSAGALLPEVFSAQGSTLLFLPLAHVFARLIQVACVETGACVAHAPDVTQLLPDLQSARPTFLLSVPRVFEKVYNSSRQRAAEGGREKVFDLAERTAVAYSEARDRGRVGPGLRLRHALFDRLVYARLREALGGQLAWAVSGGAPLGARLGHFFRGSGVRVLEGYGLTETTAAGSVTTPRDQRIGTVGRPSPGVAVRIAPDGEVLVRGDSVFRGYWRNPAATAEVLVDGWFSTGDLGALDDEGFLRITGRKKEIIVTAGGKNVSPAVLEDRLRASPLVSQCMVVGDRQPYVACLVTLDAEALGPWLAARGRPADTPVADLVDDPDVLGEVQRAVDDANAAVSRAEAVRRFRVLPEDWTEQGGQLTPSMKLRRSVVLAERADDVAALYSPG